MPALHSFRATKPLVDELHLLFGNPPGKILSNGLPDLGLNCFAKAFVTGFLARLQGLEVDFVIGRALWLHGDGRRASPFLIDPHAWVGTRHGFVLDLSIHALNGWNYITAGCRPFDGATQPVVRITNNRKKFDLVRSGRSPWEPGLQLFYQANAHEAFGFESIHHIGRTINSPHGRQIASRYPAQNVFAKAILHLHGLLDESRTPFGNCPQAEAWEQLANWKVDAVGALAEAFQLPPSLAAHAAATDSIMGCAPSCEAA
jgi:hypothetical protein